MSPFRRTSRHGATPRASIFYCTVRARRASTLAAALFDAYEQNTEVPPMAIGRLPVCMGHQRISTVSTLYQTGLPTWSVLALLPQRRIYALDLKVFQMSA